MTDDQSESEVGRDQLVSDRQLRRWNSTAEAVSIIFHDYAEKTLSFDDLLKTVQEMHRQIPEAKTSEEALKAVLRRFLGKNWLSVRKQRSGHYVIEHYSVTFLGRQVFERAREFFANRPISQSLIQGALGQVPRASPMETAPREYHFVFHPWSEIVAWKEGWPENRTLPTIRFPPFIIQQLRLMATRVQGTSAGWVWVYGQNFKIRIASRQALQTYVGESKWKDEFKDWLTTVPNLKDEDLDLIWNKVAEACKHQHVTYEFHAPDTHLAAVRPDLFRQSESQRWNRSDDTGVQLLPQTKTGSGDPCQWRGGVRGAGLHQSRSAVRSSGSLREPLQQETRGTQAGRGEALPQRTRLYTSRGSHTTFHRRETLREDRPVGGTHTPAGTTKAKQGGKTR